MTPLERAARALCSLDGLPESIVANGKPMWTQFLPQARAAIVAIREPSSAMTHAAQAESHVAGECEVDYHGIWATMIDAALEDR